jgi:Zn-dependent metalloprotease
VVKDFSKDGKDNKGSQTRSLSLTLNGVPVSGSPVSVTLTKHDEVKVKFDVLFSTAGTATLRASLSPADVNPANDTKTETVKVTGHGDGKDKD